MNKTGVLSASLPLVAQEDPGGDRGPPGEELLHVDGAGEVAELLLIGPEESQLVVQFSEHSPGGAEQRPQLERRAPPPGAAP
eukprot:2946263-Pyramimonas_sp.AAC.1